MEAAELGALVARVVQDAGVVRPPPRSHHQIVAWLTEVVAWNRQMDLTAARGHEELVDLMLADASTLACRLPNAATVVDVGSGAGAPGLPLALLRPDLQVALSEPKQKRVALLRTVVGRLALAAPERPAKGAAEIIQGRGEQLGRHFEVALSRATLRPAAWLQLGSRLAPTGQVWVLLAREQPPALDGWTLVHDVSYRWPLTGARRRALCYQRRP